MDGATLIVDAAVAPSDDAADDNDVAAPDDDAAPAALERVAGFLCAVGTADVCCCCSSCSLPSCPSPSPIALVGTAPAADDEEEEEDDDEEEEEGDARRLSR
jgi:hypothetical protein